MTLYLTSCAALYRTNCMLWILFWKSCCLWLKVQLLHTVLIISVFIFALLYRHHRLKGSLLNISWQFLKSYGTVTVWVCRPDLHSPSVLHGWSSLLLLHIAAVLQTFTKSYINKCWFMCVGPWPLRQRACWGAATATSQSQWLLLLFREQREQWREWEWWGTRGGRKPYRSVTLPHILMI